MAKAKKAVKKSETKKTKTAKKPATVKAKKSVPVPGAQVFRKPDIRRPDLRKTDVKPGPSKAKFSKEELKAFRAIILEKRKEVLEELSTIRDSMMDVQTGEYVSENSTYSTHMEQGTDAMEREKMFLFASREGKFLNYLDDALKRIDKGDYGHCLDCGKLIEKERLEAVPHSQQCIACKNRRGR
jgi:RNA polymerase-binding protein DksA